MHHRKRQLDGSRRIAGVVIRALEEREAFADYGARPAAGAA
ncbi:MAG: hypothetical protein O7G13_16730 [Alphaproteobacteria bacterium]|nr:hypothetical protein [Alphaproteobacteria bacterium]